MEGSKKRLRDVQIDRVGNLITRVKSDLDSATRNAKILWYLCHTIALVGWISGLGITGSSFNSTLGAIPLSVLGILTSIYPLLKYFDLEGRRIRYTHTSLYCSDLIIKLENAMGRLHDIDQETKSSPIDSKEFADIVSSVQQYRVNVQLMQIGSNAFDKVIETFIADNIRE